MKCPKCRHDMRRQQIDEHKYRYICGYCGLVITGKEPEPEQPDQQQPENEE